MTLNRLRIQRWILQGIDALVACLAIMLAFFLRETLASLGLLELGSVGTFSSYTFFWPLLIVVTPLALEWLHYYQLGPLEKPARSINLALQASLFIFLAMVCYQFAFSLQMSRLVLVFFVPIFTVALILRTHLYRILQERAALKGKSIRNVIIAREGESTTDWVTLMKEQHHHGLKIVDEVNLAAFDLDHFTELLHEKSIELVIFDVKKAGFERITKAIQACEDEGIESWLSVDFLNVRYARAKFLDFGNRPVLVFSRGPDNTFELLLKDLLDRLGALGLIIVLSPFMLAIAALVKLTSPGPVLFRQERSGLAGRPFTMLKFRSMVTNAEQLRDELQHLNEMTGPVFKITKDPRITPLGAWMRRTSVDELPQLFNVLAGEMSLVGPRPLPTYETQAISENQHRRRLSMKPGLTCLWQISGRNNVPDFHEWVRLDLEYIDNWSIWLDLEILLKTVPVALFGKGAK
jgi:exopolysaccharide biosynthesis polyprenyl glycosylphosphotransferase